MTKLRLSMTLAMGALFAGAVVYFSFFQPFIPGAVRTAMPVESSFVYHANSLDELLKSPVCAQLDKSLGAGNSLRELLASNKWTRLALPSEIAVADIPFRRAGQNKTWAAASWVGWRSPWLRWKMDHVSDRKMKPVKSPFVWPVWQYDAPDIARGMCLTFALTDNLFLACLSEDPTDIFFLLHAYDMHLPAANP